MSKFAYGKNRDLFAYAVDVSRGGKNVKNFLLSLSNEDFSQWPPDRFQEAFARFCGANSLYAAHAQAKSDELKGKAAPMTAVERLAKERQLQRHEYFLGKDLFARTVPEEEPEWFRALFKPEFIQRFPYRWRRMAYDHLSLEGMWLSRNTPDTELNMVSGQGAEEIVRAAVSSWSDAGQLFDFREADAWQKLEKFGQIDFGLRGAAIGIVGIREMLEKEAADAFIANLVAYAKNHKRTTVLLAAHHKDHHFFVRTKSDTQHFDSVTAHDLDRMTDDFQWWATDILTK